MYGNNMVGKIGKAIRNKPEGNKIEIAVYAGL